MADNRYGYCPQCGALGETRERRPNGDDRCLNGHRYPSRNALPTRDRFEDIADDKSVIDAALGWWESRCPIGWTLAQHLDNPTVNTATLAEEGLALVVAARVRKEHANG